MRAWGYFTVNMIKIGTGTNKSHAYNHFEHYSPYFEISPVGKIMNDFGLFKANFQLRISQLYNYQFPEIFLSSQLVSSLMLSLVLRQRKNASLIPAMMN